MKVWLLIDNKELESLSFWISHTSIYNLNKLLYKKKSIVFCKLYLSITFGTHIATFFFNQVEIIQIFLVVLLGHFYITEGRDQMSKKLEAYCRGKRDS